MNKKIAYCVFCKGDLKGRKIKSDKVVRLVCLNCKHTHYQNPTPSVLAIIEKNNKLLLVKRKYEPYKGYWDLPGGFLEIGQNLEDALRAEIKEELGVGVKRVDYFKSTVSFYKLEHMVEDVVGVAFKVRVDSYDFVVGSDAEEIRFFDIDYLPQIIPHKDTKETIYKLTLEKSNGQ